MWKLAYFQMAGSGKQRNQDALFNGQEVYYALLRKTRVLNFSDELTEPPRVSRRPNFLREYPNEKYLFT